MKKIIALSALLCMLISAVSGMNVFALNKTYYDMDFEDISFAIDVETEEKEAILNNLTGWTLSTISGEATLATVNAADIDASWAEKGKILRVQGTDAASEVTNATLKITLPVGYTYDTDKFYLEYDLFVPVNGFAGRIALFANSIWNATGTYLENGVRYMENQQYYTRAVKADLTPLVASGRIFGRGPMGSWQRYVFVLDGADFNKTFNFPTEIGANDNRDVTGIPTLRITTTDLATGVTTERAYSGVKDDIYSGSLTIGGDPSNGASSGLKGVYYLDNIKLYSVDKFSFKESSDDETTGVIIDREYVEFEMNSSILESSLSSITLKSEELESVAVSAELINDKKVRVNILEDMDYQTVYTVDFSGVKDAANRPIETAKKTISFTTENEPALYITDTKAFAGVGAYAMTTETFAADGTIYTIESQVENTVSETKEANLVYAIYDANGRLKDTAVVSKDIAAGKLEKIGTGLAIPSELAGGKVRVMLWDSITYMQPYTKPIEYSIAQ